jgi:tetratricopeptide (TPR) repeat protein
MNQDKYSKIIISVSLCLIIICTVTGFISYKALTLSHEVEKANKHSRQALKSDIDRLNSRLTILMASLQDRSTAANNAGGKKSPLSQMQKSSESLKDVNDVNNLTERNDIIKGLDNGLLKKMADEYSQKEQIMTQREQLIESNRQQHAIDRDQYDEKLGTLYESALPSPGGDDDRNESDKAFKEMLEDYPNANATGMVIAERALLSALETDTAEVESYMEMLSENENFSGVVTDMGIEAQPALQSYLASEYIQDGRFDEALAIMNSLETDYAGSIIAVRGEGASSDPNWQSIHTVVQELRNKMQSAAPR